MKKLWTEGLLLISVTFWGASFALTKPLLSNMGVFTFMASRFFIGGILLVAGLLLFRRFHPDPQQWKGGILTGALLFLAFIFHTYGLKYTTVAKNAFIVGSSVVFVPFVLTFIYRKPQLKNVWTSTFLALIGLALVTLDDVGGGINFGDLLTGVGTIIVAFYILNVEHFVKNGDPINIAAIQVLTVGLLSLIPAMAFESPFVDLSPNNLTPLMIRNLFILIVACTSIAYALANYAQKYVPATRTALLYVFEPIVGAFLGWIILSEAVGLQGIVGASLITFATLYPQLLSKEQQT